MKNLTIYLLISSILLISSNSFAANYQNQLNGKRLILQSTSCAGWEFAKNGKMAKWRNESDCTISDTYSTNWRIKWLDNDHVLLIENEQSNKSAPPRVFALQILSITGKTVKLKDIWTGWNNLADNEEIFNIK